jgi:H+/Cl- antiporter ClcA
MTVSLGVFIAYGVVCGIFGAVVSAVVVYRLCRTDKQFINRKNVVLYRPYYGKKED